MNTPEEIIQKIKAALRLARRASTDGEKAAAEAAAKRLADRNGLSLGEIEVEETRVSTAKFDDKAWKSKGLGMEIGFITAILRQHFGIVLIQNIRPSDGKIRLSWVGTAINVDIARHVYEVLMRECRKDWGEAQIIKRQATNELIGVRINKGLAKRAPETAQRFSQLAALRDLSKRSFYNGWFAAIHATLTEHPLRNDTEQLEAEKKSAEDFLKRMQEEHEIDDRKEEAKLSPKEILSFRLGASAGQDVRLNRPCESKGYNGPQTALNPPPTNLLH